MRNFMAFAFLGVLFSPFVWGQSGRFVLSGKVMDAQGAGTLPGAVVTLHEMQLHRVTDLEGNFSFENLKTGSYHLHVTMLGYEPYSDMVTLNGNKTDLVIRLKATFIELNQITVEASPLKSDKKEQSLNVQVADEDYLEKNLGGTMANTLDAIPGLSVINVGTGIAKPVIRGLSSNRIVVNDKGIKHEGQQWGSDHGLEVDQFEAGAVEVIKGPASLLYGSDAMGGVLNILPGHVPHKGEVNADILGIYRSNNQLLGTSINVGTNLKDNFFNLRYTEQSYGDYKVPADSFTYNGYVLPLENERLKNTAGSERNFSGTVGTIRNWGSLRLSVSNFHQQAGLFAGAVGVPRAYQLTDDGNERDIDLPFQENDHLKAIVNLKLLVRRSWLDADLGFQDNNRKEESAPHSHGQGPTPEGTLAHGLNLQTYNGNLHYHLYVNGRLKPIIGVSYQVQQHRREGFEFLLPNYRNFGGGAYAYAEYQQNENLYFSGGLRGDYARTTAEAYSTPVYTDDTTIAGYWQRVADLDRQFSNISGALGLSWLPVQDFNFKLNLGRSYRIPAVSEMTLNGVHHGTFRHEQGQPGLKSEVGYQADLGITYSKKRTELRFTPYFNYFENFIYLSPMGSFSPLPDAGQIYQYTQADAIHTGFEALAEYHPLKQWHLEVSVEYIYNQNLETALPLPFTPPLQIRTVTDYELALSPKWIDEIFVGAEYYWVAAQERVDRNELSTPSYQLINAHTGANFLFGKQELKLYFSLMNLLDTAYMNHMSRYRILNLPEPGRNFMVTVKLPLKINATVLHY